MRVLFVDDQPQIQSQLRASLEGVVPWRLDFAESSAKALALMDRYEYAVMVAHVPDVAQLVRSVRERHPKVARIVRSREDGLDAMLRSLFVSHQVVDVDLDLGHLVETIARAADLELLVADEGLRRLVGQVNRLPSQPAVYSRLVQLLAQPDADFRSVGQLVQSDVAITAEIIRVANTPYFSRGRTVTNVVDAVGRMGTRTVRDLVLAVEVFSAMAQGPDVAIVNEIHRHSVDVAVAARSLVAHPSDRDDAFLAGLLHDVGRLVVVSQLPSASEVVRKDNDVEREQSLIGVTHAELGAYLIGLWGLPYAIMWAAAAHHEEAILKEGPLDIASAVYVAEQIVSGADDSDVVAVPGFGAWRDTASVALGMKQAS